VWITLQNMIEVIFLNECNYILDPGNIEICKVFLELGKSE